MMQFILFSICCCNTGPALIIATSINLVVFKINSILKQLVQFNNVRKLMYVIFSIHIFWDTMIFI